MNTKLKYKIIKYDEKTCRRYIDGILAVADEGLSPGFLTRKECEHLGDDDYFCYFAVNEADDSVIALNYGRYIGEEEAAREFRTTKDTINKTFPNISVFALQLGVSVKSEARGCGLGTEMFRINKEEVLKRSPVVLNAIWIRNGEEKPILGLFDKLGGTFFAKIPRYWYNCVELYCSICKGRCVCDCDLYYYTEDSFKL